MSFDEILNIPIRISKGEQNDCFILALSAAADIKYIEAHKITTNILNRRERGGTSINENSFNSNDARNYLIKMGIDIKGVNLQNLKTKTINSFIRSYNIGNYILITRNHALSVKNGEVVDFEKFKSMNKRKVIFALKVENKRQYCLDF